MEPARIFLLATLLHPVKTLHDIAHQHMRYHWGLDMGVPLRTVDIVVPLFCVPLVFYSSSL